jgi:hypothetical protein
MNYDWRGNLVKPLGDSLPPIEMAMVNGRSISCVPNSYAICLLIMIGCVLLFNNVQLRYTIVNFPYEMEKGVANINQTYHT